jgi:hypothetical protein
MVYFVKFFLLQVVELSYNQFRTIIDQVVDLTILQLPTLAGNLMKYYYI